ncbi:hypothetical protein [Ruegeria denitrificans]|uniref:hypothetical protein n=1 Tax=Ruegeria denitrificans TaxID=1715692 RepID=UPI003C7D9FDC
MVSDAPYTDFIWFQGLARCMANHMSFVTVTALRSPDLEEILGPKERLLWSGRPGFGLKFFQAVGEERKLQIFVLVAFVALWATLPFIDADPEARFGRLKALFVYGIATLALLSFSAYLASQRQFVLSNLIYYVTDTRVIICRLGRNWRLSTRLFVVSCEHSKTFPYEVLPTRPYPSLRVGTLLSEQQVQFLGFGLSHPGHPERFDRGVQPIFLDYLANSEQLLVMIRSCAEDRKAANDA